MNSPFGRCHQWSWSCTVATVLDEKHRQQHAAADLTRLAEENQLSLWQLAGRIYTAPGCFYDGDSQGEERFHGSIRACQTQLDAQHLVAPALINFANHMLTLCKPDRARAALTDAYELIGPPASVVTRPSF